MGLPARCSLLKTMSLGQKNGPFERPPEKCNGTGLVTEKDSSWKVQLACWKAHMISNHIEILPRALRPDAVVSAEKEVRVISIR